MLMNVQMRTTPYLTANPTVGFVQTCWAFVNSGETLLTKVRSLLFDRIVSAKIPVRWLCTPSAA